MASPLTFRVTLSAILLAQAACGGRESGANATSGTLAAGSGSISSSSGGTTSGWSESGVASGTLTGGGSTSGSGGSTVEQGTLEAGLDASLDSPEPEAGAAPALVVEAGADTSDAADDVTAVVEAGSDAGPPLMPVAPSASHFGWQTLQTDFVRGAAPCTGRVTLAVSDHAVCYENASDQLACAGFTYTTNYGSTFVLAGQSGVDQVMLSVTANTPTGNAACAHTTGNQVLCFGDYNSWGQFGNGNNALSATWVRWGGSAKFTRIATGTWDQMCAVDPAGAVFCSGVSFGMSMMLGQAFGSSPEAQFPELTATSLWVDTSGTAQANDPATFRAADGRTEGTITANGLETGGATFGGPGTVVSGGPVNPPDEAPMGTCACWGDSSGAAWCGSVPNDSSIDAGAPLRVFSEAGSILYVATNYYTSDVCGVGSDGSLWCIGSNLNGELGSGNENPVIVPTRVQPAGSVMIGCR
jgi:hypothetical protein